MAKYEACAMGLQDAIDKGVKELEIYGDLTLVLLVIRRMENQRFLFDSLPQAYN